MYAASMVSTVLTVARWSVDTPLHAHPMDDLEDLTMRSLARILGTARELWPYYAAIVAI